ncbi:hypothetical protein LSH36_309g00035 [Paralvinella palmiformis]|uniref:HTH HARE-type domain-containing protein n=1 Tax=Paralvinella palmiformis TaxID=53620 RepID=A0AAD9N0W7_9ANNE|nr:hypothetical protein LSH36_309g00035 [Paralvinella palmiformis]
MEEELWILAAKQVLSQCHEPLHYTEIKRRILDKGLVTPCLKTTLEDALFKEIQKQNGRFRSVLNQPGVFELVKSEIPEEQGLLPDIQQHTTQSLLRSPLNSDGVMASQRVRAPGSASYIINQEKYKSKYKKLKHQMKDVIFINAAICDEVIRVEDKVQKAKDERRYLLARLLQHQAHDESLHHQVSGSSSGSGGKHTAQSIAQILGEVEKRKKKTGLVPGPRKKMAKELLDDMPKQKVKKKGLTGRRIVHQIPLDSLGRPIFPIELGFLTVYCLGEIVVERATFHSTEHIYPAGFCSTRVYASIHKPEEHCLYTCKIIDNGSGPRFEMSPEDAPECVFTGPTANECHLKLLKAINMIRRAEIVPLTPKGAEFFGLSHPTIQNLIQSCPGAKKCSNYKWQRFEVSRLPASEANVHEVDEPTVNIDTLYALPAFASIRPTSQSQSSLRTLLTTSPASS